MTYLALLALDQRLPEAEDLDRLRRGNQIAETTRQLFRGGRGNVKDDLERTNHESWRRVAAARDLFDRVKFDGFPAPELAAISAACAMILGNGNCGEHANAATLIGARHLRPGETMSKVEAQRIDHVWPELRADGAEPSRYDVVPDTWAVGAPAFRGDSRFASKPGATTVVFSVDKQNGQRYDLARQTEFDKLSTDPGALAFLDERLAARKMQTLNKKYIWPATPVVSDRFIATATKNIKYLQKRPNGPLLQQIVVAGAARQLGSNVAQSARADALFRPPAPRPGLRARLMQCLRYVRHLSARSTSDSFGACLGRPARHPSLDEAAG
ncbi:MAG TPA: hypothetical protein VL635_08330 [Trinickia sp.]|jgi:hypothetical protein|nr:hypothetical protein [Trinickia sp.]